MKLFMTLRGGGPRARHATAWSGKQMREVNWVLPASHKSAERVKTGNRTTSAVRCGPVSEPVKRRVIEPMSDASSEYGCHQRGCRRQGLRVCRMFGVSRSPIRVAVTRLAEDGLIEIFLQRGTFVTPIKLKQLREARFARSALEVALAEEAAHHWTEQYSVEARFNLVQQARHAKSCDSRSFFLDNEAFHQLIARAARLEGVWTTVQSVKTIWDRIGHLANRVPAHTLEIIAEHKVIVEALADRSPRDAAAAMRTHLYSVDHAIARLQPLYAGYFVGE